MPEHDPTSLSQISAPPVTPPHDGRQDTALNELLRMLRGHTGTDFSHYKPATIQRRLQKRIGSLLLPDLEAYLSRIRQQPGELDELYQSLLIGVTGFFRDPEVFAALEASLAGQLVRKAPGESLRVWVPGCATGEEAYSIALLLQPLCEQQGCQLQIFASDIDEQALSQARRGVYAAASLEPLTRAQRERWFSPRPDGDWELAPAIRKHVLFSRHDLSADPPFLKLDLISCRNLLIYFGSALQKQILPLFHYALQPEGQLLLGKSESIGPFGELFMPLDAPLKLFQRRPGNAVHPSQQFAGPAQTALAEQVRERLGKAFPHPYAVLDAQLDVIEVQGQVSAYLSLAQGGMSTQLLRLCRPELQLELRDLIAAVRKARAPGQGSWRTWPPEAPRSLLRLQVQPLSGPELLVSFEQLELQALPWAAQVLPASEREAGLAQELALARAQSQSLLREFEAAGDRLQDLDEALQAAHEELQSSHEELATTSEELQAAGEEMQLAYRELDASQARLQDYEHRLAQAESEAARLLQGLSTLNELRPELRSELEALLRPAHDL